MQGIVIDYLYRDAGNNKRYGNKAFLNPRQASVSSIKAAFDLAFSRQQLFPDILSFDPATIGWDILFFDDHTIAGSDISLHEIDCISVSQIPATCMDTVDELMKRLTALSAATKKPSM